MENNKNEKNKKTIADQETDGELQEAEGQKITEEIITPKETCSFDKKQDEKIKNYSFYTVIPFLLVSIGFSLFNIGRIRYTPSFLFLGLACLVMFIGTYLRYKNIKKCNCSICNAQLKTLTPALVLWLIGFIAGTITFIVLLAI